MDEQLLLLGVEIAANHLRRDVPIIGDERPQQTTFRVHVIPGKNRPSPSAQASSSSKSPLTTVSAAPVGFGAAKSGERGSGQRPEGCGRHSGLEKSTAVHAIGVTIGAAAGRFRHENLQVGEGRRHSAAYHLPAGNASISRKQFVQEWESGGSSNRNVGSGSRCESSLRSLRRGDDGPGCVANRDAHQRMKLIAAMTKNATAKGTCHWLNLSAIMSPVQRPWISNPTPATSQSKAKNNLTEAGFIQVPVGRRPIFGRETLPVVPAMTAQVRSGAKLGRYTKRMRSNGNRLGRHKFGTLKGKNRQGELHKLPAGGKPQIDPRQL